MLEHLADVGSFLKLCHNALARNGTLKIRKDDVMFLPVYLPFSFCAGLGIGAHSSNKYALRMNRSVHYYVFTRMHLLGHAGFDQVSVQYDVKTLGARLIARGARRRSGNSRRMEEIFFHIEN
ncbi:MAG TPA: hypothetical protein VFF30_09540 [Nitrososphaerales archaeon]|nr:hypothetical protein [Nitrososphaerales archaeon]